jgi:hypothetical protein
VDSGAYDIANITGISNQVITVICKVTAQKLPRVLDKKEFGLEIINEGCGFLSKRIARIVSQVVL